MPTHPKSTFERRFTTPEVGPPIVPSTKTRIELTACPATAPRPTNPTNNPLITPPPLKNNHPLPTTTRTTNPLRLSRPTFLYRQPTMRQRPPIRELVQPRGRLPRHLRSPERTGVRRWGATSMSVGWTVLYRHSGLQLWYEGGELSWDLH